MKHQIPWLRVFVEGVVIVGKWLHKAQIERRSPSQPDMFQLSPDA